MASPAYEQILSIQALDLSLRQHRHRIANHPIRERIAEIDGRLAEHDASAAEVEERRHALQREQKRMEDEVATIEAKRADIDGKLYGGEVTASKELLALQDEAAQLLDRQRAIEDQQLELMETAEEIDGELGALAEQRSGAAGEREAADAELRTDVAHIEAEIVRVETERADAAGPANQELLARYESLREEFDGVAVARLVNGGCDGCHIQLSAVAVDQAMKMPEDAVVSCEECGRLLVR